MGLVPISKITSGVYIIKNSINDDYYIGSSINVHKRMCWHFSALTRNRHYNVHLQRAWNLYGSSSFIFTPILYCDKNMVKFYEQRYLDRLIPAYNLSNKATGWCGEVTESRRELARKLGLSQKGRRKPKSYSDLLSKRMVGNQLCFGREASEPFCKSLSERNKGNTYFARHTHTEEWKNQMSEKMKNRVFSDETRKKMSESAKIRKQRELALKMQQQGG